MSRTSKEPIADIVVDVRLKSTRALPQGVGAAEGRPLWPNDRR